MSIYIGIVKLSQTYSHLILCHPENQLFLPYHRLQIFRIHCLDPTSTITMDIIYDCLLVWKFAPVSASPQLPNSAPAPTSAPSSTAAPLLRRLYSYQLRETFNREQLEYDIISYIHLHMQWAHQYWLLNQIQLDLADYLAYLIIL